VLSTNMLAKVLSNAKPEAMSSACSPSWICAIALLTAADVRACACTSMSAVAVDEAPIVSMTSTRTDQLPELKTP